MNILQNLSWEVTCSFHVDIEDLIRRFHKARRKPIDEFDAPANFTNLSQPSDNLIEDLFQNKDQLMSLAHDDPETALDILTLQFILTPHGSNFQYENDFYQHLLDKYENLEGEKKLELLLNYLTIVLLTPVHMKVILDLVVKDFQTFDHSPRSEFLYVKLLSHLWNQSHQQPSGDLEILLEHILQVLETRISAVNYKGLITSFTEGKIVLNLIFSFLVGNYFHSRKNRRLILRPKLLVLSQIYLSHLYDSLSQIESMYDLASEDFLTREQFLLRQILQLQHRLNFVLNNRIRSRIKEFEDDGNLQNLVNYYELLVEQPNYRGANHWYREKIYQIATETRDFERIIKHIPGLISGYLNSDLLDDAIDRYDDFKDIKETYLQDSAVQVRIRRQDLLNDIVRYIFENFTENDLNETHMKIISDYFNTIPSEGTPTLVLQRLLEIIADNEFDEYRKIIKEFLEGKE